MYSRKKTFLGINTWRSI